MHERHSNLGHGVKRVNYVQYLDEFDAFDKIARSSKTDAYAKYLQALLDYLKSFYARAFPLKDLDDEMQRAVDDFNKKWARGQVEGWTEANANGAPAKLEGIWCEACKCKWR